MRKRLLITSSLALVLGLGVAGGLSLAKKNVKAVEAAGTVTVYCKMTYGWWTTADAAIGVHYWGGDSSTSWPGVRMSPSTEYNVWKASVPSNSTGLMFTRINGSGTEAYWSHKTGDLTLQSDKNLYTITSESNPGEVVAGSWSSYTEDVPAEDGYYIVGTKSSWKFAGATKMDAGQNTDKAQLLQYVTSADEQFKVRSYLNGVATWYGINGTESNYVAGSIKVINVYINGSDQLYVSEITVGDVINNDKARIWIGYDTSNPFYDYADADTGIRLWIHSTSSGGSELVYGTITGTYNNAAESNRRYDYFDVDLSVYTNQWYMTVQKFQNNGWKGATNPIQLKSDNAFKVYFVGDDWAWDKTQGTITPDVISSVDARLAAIALCGIHNCSPSAVNGYNAFSNFNSTFVKNGDAWRTVGNVSDYFLLDFASGDSSYSGGKSNIVNAYDKYVFVQNMYASGGASGLSAIRFGLIANVNDNNNTLLIVIVASILAVVAVGGYFFLKRKNEK